MGGRAQSAWKVSYLWKSIHCGLLSSYFICEAVVQQVCSLQGHKSTYIDIFLPSQQLSLWKSMIFALFLSWYKGSGWCWVVINCDSALAKAWLIPKLVKGWAGSILPSWGMGTGSATHSGCKIGLPFCLSAGAMACLRRSFEYFKLQYFVGDRLFSKKSFSHRHLAFLVMPPFFFLFSEYSFSRVHWKHSNPLNVTFIKDGRRVKSTSFYCVLYIVTVIFKETTATGLSHFYLCFIFNFSSIKSWYPPPFSWRLSRELCNWQYSELFLKGLTVFFSCVSQEFKSCNCLWQKKCKEYDSNVPPSCH